jgi:hypothetical protein
VFNNRPRLHQTLGYADVGLCQPGAVGSRTCALTRCP